MRDVLVVAALAEEVAPLGPVADTLVTGPGKVQAATGLAAALAQRRAEGRPVGVVLNLGTAGALRPGLQGVHEVGTVVQHDFDSDAFRAALGVEVGSAIRLSRDGLTLATGDRFVAAGPYAQRLRERGVDLVDMEGYAYAHVCRDLGVDFRCVKVVSDDGDLDDWKAALSSCAEALAAWYREQ